MKNRILNLAKKKLRENLSKDTVGFQYWILALTVRPYKILTHNLHVLSSKHERSGCETPRGHQYGRVHPFLPGMHYELTSISDIFYIVMRYPTPQYIIL